MRGQVLKITKKGRRSSTTSLGENLVQSPMLSKKEKKTWSDHLLLRQPIENARSFNVSPSQDDANWYSHAMYSHLYGPEYLYRCSKPMKLET